jgi:nicotinate dehydrogenase subunit B
MSARKLPGSLDGNRMLNQWLSINTDGTVTVRPGKVEFGQGILTVLVQMVAEELDVAVERIRIETASTAYSPDEGITSGSRSIQESGIALRYASAETRERLIARAAQRLGVSMEQLTVSDGTVQSRDGKSTTYWELADEGLLKSEANGDTVPKPALQHAIVGRSLHRLDIPAKVTGQPVYLQDMEIPGMLHGRVVRPSGPGARLTAVDTQEVEAMPGVRIVVRDGNFLAVIAEREEEAIRAQRRLARSAQWQAGKPLPDENPRYLQHMASEDEVISEKVDAAAEQRAARRMKAEYSRPHIAHASMAPSCAIARFDDGCYRIWTHSQGIFPLRRDLSKVLGVEESSIVVTHAEGAGCYGHNGADDVALDAALLARALPGRAVRVQWMREDEFAWEPYGSPMVVAMEAALDEKGDVVSWSHELWSHGHSTRPGGKSGANLLAGWHLAQPVAPATPGNPPLPAGGSHRNAIPLYEFSQQKIVNHLVREAPLRASSLRSLGSHANVLAIESFLDEIAATSGADPIEFRLRYLKDARARSVIEAVAKAAGWKAGEQGDGTRGRGIGFCRYKNLGSYVAIIAEVAVAEEVRVTQAWAAVDVGQIINPDGVKNQIEGGIIQATSWTLKEKVRYDREQVVSRDWESYPVLTFAEAPLVHVHLIDRPDHPPVGAGEGAQGPMAAAIANAIYNAMGVRLRDMPFTRDRLISAMV